MKNNIKKISDAYTKAYKGFNGKSEPIIKAKPKTFYSKTLNKKVTIPED